MNARDAKNPPYGSGEKNKKKSLAVSQFVDLFCYVLACSEYQQQPEVFIPPSGAEVLTMITRIDGQQVSVWINGGWPMAITDSYGNFFRVLSGIPAASF